MNDAIFAQKDNAMTARPCGAFEVLGAIERLSDDEQGGPQDGERLGLLLVFEFGRPWHQKLPLTDQVRASTSDFCSARSSVEVSRAATRSLELLWALSCWWQSTVRAMMKLLAQSL